MEKQPGKYAWSVTVGSKGISKKCSRIVRQNIVLALGVKFICLILAAFGIANMWVAIIADVGVMIVAVLNAIRCLFVSKQ